MPRTELARLPPSSVSGCNRVGRVPRAWPSPTGQTVQALDDMLHVLVMDKLDPDMLILQHFLEVGGPQREKWNLGVAWGLVPLRVEGRRGAEAPFLTRILAY